MELTTEPEVKKIKMNTVESEANIKFSTSSIKEAEQLTTINGSIQCKHFVQRKKRFCKMTVSKGMEYCGEHIPNEDGPVSNEAAWISEEKRKLRIPCPLDPKHTVFSWNLEKHLKCCNAKAKDLPQFIEKAVNNGSDDEASKKDVDNFKLSELDASVVQTVIEKINLIYERFVAGIVTELYHDNHSAMAEEFDNREYGPETLKHLQQTSSILNYLSYFNLLNDKTSFVEFGAGRGQVSYWLARASEKFTDSNVLLVDRASHRHKKDNKIIDRNTVHRIRADIADLNLKKLDLIKQKVVGVSKHLCGAATDLTIRCILNCNEDAAVEERRIQGFVIALCCHHRCEWQSFVGKRFLIENEINKKDFIIMTKLASWAVCGSGMSRERRKAIEEQSKTTITEKPAAIDLPITNKLSLEEKQQIGYRCKRILDYARLHHLKETQKGYTFSLNYYVPSDITLENVCLVGVLDNLKTN